MIAHTVFFTLHDDAPEKARDLIAACQTHLSGHPGVAFFAAGVRGADFKRNVNVVDWHVSLHIVFRTKADHDRYQVAPRHEQFVAENKANWKQVRVFDSDLAG